jgi:hypothetical protein
MIKHSILLLNLVNKQKAEFVLFWFWFGLLLLDRPRPITNIFPPSFTTKRHPCFSLIHPKLTILPPTTLNGGLNFKVSRYDNKKLFMLNNEIDQFNLHCTKNRVLTFTVQKIKWVFFCLLLNFSYSREKSTKN